MHHTKWRRSHQLACSKDFAAWLLLMLHDHVSITGAAVHNSSRLLLGLAMLCHNAQPAAAAHITRAMHGADAPATLTTHLKSI